MVKEGLRLGVLNAKEGTLFSKAQRFFTGYNITHSFIILKEYYGTIQLLDAREVITLDPIDRIMNPGVEAWFYIIPMSKDQADEIEKRVYDFFIGRKYGYLQIIWFIWRRLNELIGRDIRKQRNWFRNGVICSELVYCALDILSWKEKWVKEYIKEWNINTIHSGDIKMILDKMTEDGKANKYTL